MTRLWLASASPRRREILRSLGIVFDVHVTDVDESERAGEPPEAYVARVARDKRSAAQRVLDGAVIAADTTVAIDGRVLAKPRDDADARRMLAALSGRAHLVHTGLSVANGGRTHERVITTEVDFAVLDAGTIDRYVATGEPRDKAGAYGIQGIAGGFVTGLRGSYSNVVGLPAREVVEALLEVGALERWPAEPSA
jgi:septum formation protein